MYNKSGRLEFSTGEAKKVVRKTKEEAERTYHALLDAAGKTFIRQGVAKTTLNEIASEAGLTRGAVYWHFKNKDAVIRALWDRNAQALHGEFIGSLRELDAKDPAGHFCRLTKDILKRAVSNPEMGLVLRIIVHNLEFTDEATELQSFLIEKEDQMTSGVSDAFETLREKGLLKSNLSSELLANSFMSYTHGLLHTYYSPGQTGFDLLEDGDVVMDLFLDALLEV